jgi:predicted RNase H-like nuclease
VLGVDGCRGGWIGVVFDGETAWGQFAPAISQLVDGAGAVDVVAIDMPIGLPDAARRQADELARRAIGPRSSSVFTTPCRAALEAPTHAEASEINRSRVGEGVSVQAYHLRKSIFDVDLWVRTATHRVIEVHPELTFTVLAGDHLTSRKATWAGAKEREDLLRRAGIVLDGTLGAAGHRAGVDDVLDAAAAAWSAWRHLHGRAVSLPAPPEVMPDGWPAAIWA